MTQKFQYIPVHAHVNLLGWASLAISGLVCHLFPAAANNRLAAWHFWLYNIGVAAFVISLALVTSGVEAMLPVAIASALTTLVAVVLFAINIFRNLEGQFVRLT